MPLDFSSSHEPSTSYSLAGLADIVLLLLIFFLLTSTFIPQLGIQINLPEASASAPADAEWVQVAISDEGRYYVGHEEVRRENLVDAIRAEAGDDREALLLRADKTASIEQFAAVASVAQSLGLRVSMATEMDDQ